MALPEAGHGEQPGGAVCVFNHLDFASGRCFSEQSDEFAFRVGTCVFGQRSHICILAPVVAQSMRNPTPADLGLRRGGAAVNQSKQEHI